MTALHHAAMGGFTDAVTILLDAKWKDENVIDPDTKELMHSVNPDTKDNVSTVQTYFMASFLCIVYVPS